MSLLFDHIKLMFNEHARDQALRQHFQKVLRRIDREFYIELNGPWTNFDPVTPNWNIEHAPGDLKAVFSMKSINGNTYSTTLTASKGGFLNGGWPVVTVTSPDGREVASLQTKRFEWGSLRYPLSRWERGDHEPVKKLKAVIMQDLNRQKANTK